mmetsp:Transcript_4846/g.8488  ORF Transcript_4846/g.8488 Transcript_4846/m.8488 type:complete len:538 (-) Transcript_4846:1191-2804(-)
MAGKQLVNRWPHCEVSGDLETLMDRVFDGQEIYRSDFEALIRQYRKKKQPAQPRAVLDFMKALSSSGLELGHGSMGPLPALAPDLRTYNVVIETCMSMEEHAVAWVVLDEAEARGLEPDTATLKIIVSWALKNGDAEVAARAFWRFAHLRVTPCHKVAARLMRGLGGTIPHQGLAILQALTTPSALADPPLPPSSLSCTNNTSDAALAALLLESAASLGEEIDAGQEIVAGLLALREGRGEAPRYLTTDPDVTLGLLMCCAAQRQPGLAEERRRQWQAAGALCPLPFVGAVLAEALAAVGKGTFSSRDRRWDPPPRPAGLPYLRFRHQGVLKFLVGRRPFLRHIMAPERSKRLGEILLPVSVPHLATDRSYENRQTKCGCSAVSVHQLQHDHLLPFEPGDSLLKAYTSASIAALEAQAPHSSPAPTIFAHHVSVRLSHAHCKCEKTQLQSDISDALAKCHPSLRWDFIFSVIENMPHAKTGSKSGGKIVRLIISNALKLEEEENVPTLFEEKIVSFLEVCSLGSYISLTSLQGNFLR